MPVSGYTPDYRVESPYRLTPVVGNFMFYYVHRQINPQPDDVEVKMDNPTYIARPDLLAQDMYGDDNLWWVFGVRNGWQDPVYDLQLNIQVFIPQLHYIRSVI